MLIAARNAFITRLLPYDAEIEYLESTGTQWIDTGVYPNGGTDWELCMFMSSRPNGNVFGSRNVSSGTPAWGLITHSGGASWSIARLAMSWNEIFPAEFGTVNVYAFRDGVATYNGEPKGTSSGNVQVNYPAVIYAYNNGGNIPSPSALRVLYCKIWQSGVLVRDFIPVRRGTTGYLYDRVTKRLFGNAGSGDFVCGPDVIPVEYIESHGTEYIDTGIKWDCSGDIKCLFAPLSDSGINAAFGVPGTIDFSVYNNSKSLIAVNGAWTGYVDWSNAVSAGDRFFFDLSTHTLTKLSTGEYKTFTGSGDAISSTNLMLFKANTFVGRCRMYSFSCTSQGSRIVPIPVRVGSGSTWEGAMMNVLTRRIYRNAGTGAFTYGNDLKYPIPAE